jgi:hypothetical protein
MPLSLAFLIVASWQSESRDGLPSWAYSLSLDGAETRPLADELPGVLQAEPPAGRGRDRDVSDFTLNVAAHARYAIPFGAADRSYIVYGNGLWVVDHYVSWSDFFHPGWGFDLELDIFLAKNGPGPNQQPGFNYGIAVVLTSDEFGGDHVNDSLGRSLSIENLTMSSILIGGKVIHTLGHGFYADGSFGVGAVHYSAVEGTFSGLGPSFRDEILEDTWTFASQFRGHAGYRLGPLGIVAGLGFRIQAPPHEGDRISMNSGAFWTFDLDLGVELGF